MELGRLLVASDGSPRSEHALDLGKQLAARTGAMLAIVEVREREPGGEPLAAHPGSPPGATAATMRRTGIAGVEIARCAHEWKADLVVLGRDGRSGPGIGKTTEMVLRRRHGPVLMVPGSITTIRRILYALDGSERGLGILDRGGHFASVTGATALAVCVLPQESAPASPGTAWPHPRRTRVEGAMERRPDLGGPEALTIRWGEPVAEVLRHLEETGADLLVLGLRQGGPGGDPGSGHVARDLLRTVPVAILTIPI